MNEYSTALILLELPAVAGVGCGDLLPLPLHDFLMFARNGERLTQTLANIDVDEMLIAVPNPRAATLSPKLVSPFGDW